MIRQRLSLILLLSLLLTAPASSAGPARGIDPYGGATPEALMQRLRAAVAAEDFATVAACLAREDRATLGASLAMTTGMVLDFALSAADTGEDEARVSGLREDYEAILEQRGMEDRLADSSSALGHGTDASEAPAGVDWVTLTADLMELLRSLPGGGRERDGGEAADLPIDLPVGELTELHVEGDHATGKTGAETVDFLREDGRWYISLGPRADGSADSRPR